MDRTLYEHLPVFRCLAVLLLLIGALFLVSPANAATTREAQPKELIQQTSIKPAQFAYWVRYYGYRPYYRGYYRPYYRPYYYPGYRYRYWYRY